MVYYSCTEVVVVVVVVADLDLYIVLQKVTTLESHFQTRGVSVQQEGSLGDDESISFCLPKLPNNQSLSTSKSATTRTNSDDRSRKEQGTRVGMRSNAVVVVVNSLTRCC